MISLGGSTDVDFGEIIDYLVDDPKTEHILLYIEGVRDARRFVSALRAAARLKPVILMKVGRHPAGVRAAVSHTGAIVGLDDVFDAVVRRAGVIRVTTIGQLVADAWHTHGLGRRLMESLIGVARERGLRLMIGHILAENRAMLAFCSKLGFEISSSAEGPMVKRAALALN